MADSDAQPPNDGSSGSEPRLRHRILKTGESYGNFRIVECICPGLIVNYYRAQHVRDLREVTIGIFHPKTLEDTKFLRRLVELKERMESVEHKGIPRILDCAQVDRLHCIHLEPVAGTTLSDFFAAHTEDAEGTGIEDGVVRDILAQLLGLVGIAHSHGLDHRDLESNFVLVQDDGSLCILGLGIRAAVGMNIFEAIVSASVSPLASNKCPKRMSSFDVLSPEYQQGLPEDFRVDINAVGIIGYWLLTGAKVKRGEYVSPSSLVEGLNPEWDEFIEKSIARKPDERFASARAALLGLKDTAREPTSESAGSVQRQIDRVPVPKSIRQRGERATALFRLALIGVVGLTLVGLASYFYTVTFVKADVAYERSVATEADGEEEADFFIEVSPPVARVQFSGTGDAFITSGGRLALKLIRGSHRIKVSAPNHVPALLEVERGRGEVVEMAVSLKPAWTDFQILSEPGARVSVVDAQGQQIDLGRVGADGVFYLQKGIFAGNYDIIIEKEGFERLVLKNREIAFGELTQLEAPLSGLPSSVVIRSDPAGAAVTLDGLPVGHTPLEIPDLESKKNHLVSIELAGYRSVGRRVQLEPGEAQVVDFGKLVPPSGELSFDISIEGGAPVEEDFYEALSVAIDGTAVPYASPDLKQVLEGKHTLRLLHPLYISDPVEIEIRDRDVVELAVVMKPRPGLVEIKIPDGLEATILADGRPVEADAGRVAVPADRPVELSLMIPDYLTMRRNVELASNEVLVWDVRPVPIPGPVKGEAWEVPYLGIEFSWIAPGSFTMGSPLREVGRLPDEGPETEVRFTYGFWIGSFEVTQGQYRRVMQENPSAFDGLRRPVENITWEDANGFCRLITQLESSAGRLPEGYAYRLPLEAEWEFAARCGTRTPFYWGERADPSMGNFEGRYPKGSDAPVAGQEHYGTVPVGSFSANPCGLFDVHGNVREFTLDYYNGRHPGGSVTDPQPRRDGLSVAARGGSWKDTATHARIAERVGIRSNTRSNAVGFRIVLAPQFE